MASPKCDFCGRRKIMDTVPFREEEDWVCPACDLGIASEAEFTGESREEEIVEVNPLSKGK